MAIQDVVNNKKKSIMGKVGSLQSVSDRMESLHIEDIDSKLDILINDTDNIGFETLRSKLHYMRLYLKNNINFNPLHKEQLLKEIVDGIDSPADSDTYGFYLPVDTTDENTVMRLRLYPSTFAIPDDEWNHTNLIAVGDRLIYTDYKLSTDTDFIYPDSNKPSDIGSNFDVYNSTNNYDSSFESDLQTNYINSLTFESGAYNYNSNYLSEPLSVINYYESSTYGYDLEIEIDSSGNLDSTTINNGGTGLTDGQYRLTEIDATNNSGTVITDGYITISGGTITQFVINEPSDSWNTNGPSGTVYTLSVSKIYLLDSTNSTWDNWNTAFNDDVNSFIDVIKSYLETYKSYINSNLYIWDNIQDNLDSFVSSPSTWKTNFEDFEDNIQTTIDNLESMKISLDNTVKTSTLNYYLNGNFRTAILSEIDDLVLLYPNISSLLTSGFYNDWLFWVKELIDKKIGQNIGSYFLYYKESDKALQFKNDIMKIKNSMNKIGISVNFLDTPFVQPPIPSENGVTIFFETVNYATEYIIERKLDGGSYSILTTTTNNEYEDSTVESGNTYYYRVKAKSVDYTFFDERPEYEPLLQDIIIVLDDSELLGSPLESDYSIEYSVTIL